MDNWGRNWELENWERHKPKIFAEIFLLQAVRWLCGGFKLQETRRSVKRIYDTQKFGWLIWHFGASVMDIIQDLICGFLGKRSIYQILVSWAFCKFPCI